jgi:hypothetical protein
LVTLYWQHQALRVLVNADRKVILPDAKTQFDRLTNEVEREFMTLLAVVKKQIKHETLTAVQKEIFEREFFTIPLPDVG